jgi:acetyl esterase
MYGGGFVTGDVERAEPITRRLADQLPVRVVSVEYRLAPEHPYPSPLDDERTVFEWAISQGLPLAVGGDSAGANIAAHLAIDARDRGIASASAVGQSLARRGTRE